MTNGSVVYENREIGLSVRTNLDDAGKYHVRTHDRDGLPPGSYQVAIPESVDLLTNLRSEVLDLFEKLGGDPMEFRYFGCGISLRREQAQSFSVSSSESGD